MIADSWLDPQVDAWLHRRIVEQMPLAVAVWQAETDDLHGLRLVYVNPYNETTVGADLSPFVGQHLPDAFPSIVNTPLPGHILAVALEREPGYHEIHETAGAPEARLQLDVRPLGRRCALVSYTDITDITDITEQQAAAAQCTPGTSGG